jgi:hypothetical protein
VTSSGTVGGRTKASSGTLWLGTVTEGVTRLDIDGFFKLTATPPVVPPTPPETTVGIEETGNETKAMLYPNPSDNVVHLQLEKVPQHELLVSISDVTGRVWHRQSITEQNTGLPAAQLTPGMYIIQWRDENGIQTRKFMRR